MSSQIRRAVAAGMAFVLMLACTACGEGADGEAADAEIEAILSNMSLRDKLGQMMLVSFRVWKEPAPEAEQPAEDTGTPAGQPVEASPQAEQPGEDVIALNDEIRACLRDGRFGSVILFAQNCHDAEQTLRLVADMQAANREGGGLPLLIGIDQEGGSVVRLGFGTSGVGNMALAAAGSPEAIRQMAAIHGTELALLGIHADYAPVLDVNNQPRNPIIGVRSFSDDPQTAAACGLEFLEGLQSRGVIATLKHFPGHGNTDTDSHTGFPCIRSTYEELKACELIPFQAAIDAGAEMVMTAHIQYPQIERQTYTSVSTGEEVFLPATMSRVIMTDILRGDMGFDGVIVTDALDMAAVAENFAREDVLCMAVNAGVDMMLLPPVMDADQFRAVTEWLDTAVRLAEEGRIDLGQIDDSVRRILKLKQRHGLLHPREFTVTEQAVQAAVKGVGSAENRRIAWDIALQAATLLRNEHGAFPLQIAPGTQTLILFADSCASRAGAGQLAADTLAAQGVLPEGAEIRVLTHSRENDAECLQAAAEADHVILVHRTYSAACLDPATDDGFSSAIFDQIIAARHDSGRTVILVSCQLPYDAARFPEADAILLTYGSSPMRTVPPESGEGSAFVPNLPAALCACFGLGTPQGRLPVNLPALDENRAFTDEILFSR